MHRDVKPGNIMYDCMNNNLKLIDWGLADFYTPGQHYNVRVATRFYKSPELLTGDSLYHYSADVWSAGCTFAEIILRQGRPLFMGKDNDD